MRDPFKPQSNKQLIREAQFGFTVIGLLIAVLIYVAWYRINGLHDRTPEHIRNSPVASQVYPNSPNYDQQTHQMVAKSNTPIMKPATMSQSNGFASGLPTNTPRRIMNESQRTARSLSNSAETIDKSVTKVASLIKPPAKIDRGPAANPAADSKRDSGFKILKTPTNSPSIDTNRFSVVAKPSLPNPSTIEASKFKTKEPNTIEAQPFKPSSSFKSASSFEPTSSFEKSIPFVAKPVEAKQVNVSNPLLPKPAVPVAAPSNDFKPLQTDRKVQLPATTPVKPIASKPLISVPTQAKPDLLMPRLEGAEEDAGLSKVSKPASKESAFRPFGTYKPSSDQSPLKVPSLEEPAKIAPTQPLPTAEPKPDSNTREPNRLRNLSDQSLSSLRSTEIEEPGPVIVPKVKSTVQPVSFETTKWTVRKGESFWSIAQANYGDPRFFRALYEMNRRKVPGFEDLSEGVELELPSEETLIEKYPDLCPADAVHKNDPWRATPKDLMDELTDCCNDDLKQRLYETKTNDTLFEIARRQLGQASRYAELIELNRFRIGEDVSHETVLPTGIKILLPEK